MVGLDEIQLILSGVIKASEKLYVIEDGKGVWKGIPEYYEGYKDAVKQKSRIETHAEVDKFPHALFAKRAPNQNEEEDIYVRENYKNTTHPVYMDYLAVTSRGLQDNNWRIKYPEGDSEAEDYNEYITEDIDVFKSVESYVKNIVPSLRGKDANGVMTFEIKPPKMVEVNGEIVQDDTERLEPQPKYYSSPQVVAWEWNTYGMFESHDKSIVQYSNKAIKAGRVFYFYDDVNIWKITQVGKFVDHTYTYEVVFEHDLGEFPCKKLGGVPSILDDGSIYYTSRFYFAVDLLDWSLLYSNYLNVSIANVCFPFRWMVGDECDFQDSHGGSCNSGFIYGNEGAKLACPSCQGSGMKVRTSPMKTYLLKPKQGQDEGDTSFPEPIGFVSPKTDTLEFTKETAKEYTEEARSILHVKTTNDKATGKDDTATGDLIDLKAMFAFVQPDSDQTFDVFQFLLDVTGKVREGADFEGATLVYPKTFDFRTDADILEDIKVARDAGAPTHIVNSLIFQYINHRFYAEKETALVSSLIVSADRLLTLTNDDIMKRKAQNAVENWEIVLHDSAFQLVNELIAEDPEFLNLELQAQVERLETKAKEKTPTATNILSAQERAARILGN
jgi:hypothetical protein